MGACSKCLVRPFNSKSRLEERQFEYQKDIFSAHTHYPHTEKYRSIAEKGDSVYFFEAMVVLNTRNIPSLFSLVKICSSQI